MPEARYTTPHPSLTESSRLRSSLQSQSKENGGYKVQKSAEDRLQHKALAQQECNLAANAYLGA